MYQYNKYACIYTNPHTHTHAHTYTHTYTHTHTPTHTHTHTHTHTYTHIYIRTNIHTHTHTYTNKYTYKYTHPHPHTHTHTPTHTHPHTPIHTHLCHSISAASSLLCYLISLTRLNARFDVWIGGVTVALDHAPDDYAAQCQRSANKHVATVTTATVACCFVVGMMLVFSARVPEV